MSRKQVADEAQQRIVQADKVRNLSQSFSERESGKSVRKASSVES